MYEFQVKLIFKVYHGGNRIKICFTGSKDLPSENVNTGISVWNGIR